MLIILGLFIYYAPNIEAASGTCINKDRKGVIISTAIWPDDVLINLSVNVTVQFTNQTVAGKYFVILSDGKPIGAQDYSSQIVDLTTSQLRNGIEVTFPIGPVTEYRDSYYVKLQREGFGDICEPSNLGTIAVANISDNKLKKTQCSISVPGNIQIGDNLTIKYSVSNPPSENSRFIPLIFKTSNFAKMPTGVYRATGAPLGDFANTLITPKYLKQDQVTDLTFPTDTGTFNQIENFTAAMAVQDDSSVPGDEARLYICKSANFSTSNNPTTPAGTPATSAPAGFPKAGTGSGGGEKCTSGFLDEKNNPVPAIDTAIGCVPTEPVAFIKAFLRFTLATFGGIAFLIMVMGVFRMITSAGNPDALKAGQEMFTSAIIGILFIIFSVLLLQIIGVGILNIPGFR